MNYKTTRVACYTGSVVQAIINNFLPLLFVMFNERYALTYAELGFVILLNFGSQLCTDISSIRITERFGTRKTVVAAHFLCTAGLVLLYILPSILGNAFLAICIATLFSSVGGGLIEVLVSPIMDRISPTGGRRFMAFLHSFYCWGQILTVLLTTLAIKVFGENCWQTIALCWATIPLCNAFAFLCVPIVEQPPQRERIPVVSLIKNKVFILCSVLMVCAGAAELTISQWASAFAEQGLGITKLEGDILGPCAFAFFMGVGRLLYSSVSQRLKIKTVLTCCSAFTSVCYLVTALAQNSIVSIVGCALCGLGVSVMWPGVYSFASEQFKNGGNPMFSLLAMTGDLGCTLGPWIAGMIAGVAELRTAILVCTVFPAVAVISLLVARPRTSNDDKNV